jgi:hypothetical protein
MKLICTASKVSWFTVGREYEMDYWRLEDNDGVRWCVEHYRNRYRTENLEDAEFSVAQYYEPVTVADDAPPSEQVQHEALLAAVVQMADEEGCRASFDMHLAKLRKVYRKMAGSNSHQRAFLLALAYFAEEQSQ